MSEPVRLIILGCGGRGTGYANWVRNHPDRAKIVAIAEPRDFYRNRIGDQHNIPEEMRFRSWEEVAANPKFADAVLICMMDDLHEIPSVAFAGMGYHIMLEKPMAPTEAACRRIADAVRRSKIMFAVCHVLRYTYYTRHVKKLIADGSIGQIVSIQHLEPVGHWHQCHSFVRGNWRNEKETCFMLLAKCCHDIDWIRYIMDRPCTKIQSFGSLFEFRQERRPEGAASRCAVCPPEVESLCPASALKIYMRDRMIRGLGHQWPTDVLTPDITPRGVMLALREGPYGRCAYQCDNDVVDNQVVNMSFKDGATAQMLMTAFCNERGRQTRIFGTRGAIRTDSNIIHLTDFLTNETKEIDTNIVDDGSILSGHGGGDGGLMDSFVSALETGDPSTIRSGVDDTLESHLMCFKAEESRKTGTVCSIE